MILFCSNEIGNKNSHEKMKDIDSVCAGAPKSTVLKHVIDGMFQCSPTSAIELSSRMIAMSNATDNTEELIQKLDLHYNKVRQANIIREINRRWCGSLEVRWFSYSG